MEQETGTRHIAIYKYQLALNDTQHLSLPRRAKILTVQVQGSRIMLWALVDPDESDVSRHTIMIVGTGHRHDASLFESALYLGTVHDNGFVWHVFDLG